MSTRLGARDLLGLVLDAGSFTSWDRAVDLFGLPPEYLAELSAAAARSGTDESVITGRGLVRGRPVAVVVNEFRFLAGTVGRAAAERIVAAVRRATSEGLPLLAATSSGGTRMHEGTPAFVWMTEISRALVDHRAAGLPYLAYLRHPTTGGVFASWGALAHVTAAEPGALVGFLGPKVYESLTGRPFPQGVQTSENLAAHGIVDGVVHPRDLPALLDRTLGVLIDPPAPPQLPRRAGEITERDVWDCITSTRADGRAGVRELLRHGATGTVVLSDAAEPGRTMMVALTRLDGQPCVVVGQDRSRQTPEHPMDSSALRLARRGMQLAEELRLPLLTVIDTPGAELSRSAEESGLAREIACCIAALTGLSVPTVSVLLGQGCGGGALALFPADTVIAAERSWLSPLPPEGASAIVYGDLAHAAELARSQRVRAVDMHADGAVQVLVPERDSDTPAELAVAVAAACGEALSAATAGT